ncbi:TlpA family protein disulfide reductase [Rhodoflexus sp.]
MKAKYLYLCCILIMCNKFGVYAQNPDTLLHLLLDKCRRTQTGYYEMLHYQKFMDYSDTSISRHRVNFRKVPSDTISGVFFYKQQQTQSKGKTFTSENLYNGQEYAFTYDDTATIMSVQRWTSQIKNYLDNNRLHPLLMQPDKSYITSNWEKWKVPVRLVGKEKIGNVDSYHVQFAKEEAPDPKQILSLLRSQYDFWISEADSVPIQYDITYKILQGPDTVWQYDRYLLTKYEWNTALTDSLFSLQRLPKNLTIKEYTPYEAPELLKAGEPAPLWELPSLTDEVIRLEDLRGSLVLIDFYYKSCYPCLLALPELQALHEKYKDKGLKVIGVNPFDKKSDGIAEFLQKRNIAYTSVLDDGQKTATIYRVSGYPTLYLIDRKGDIVFVQQGFGTATGKKLEEEILKHL